MAGARAREGRGLARRPGPAGTTAPFPVDAEGGTELAGPEGGPIPLEVSERARETLLRRLDGMAERFNNPIVVPMVPSGDTS